MRDGTLIFTDQGGPILNRALHLRWTHVLVWLDGIYYEATWPRVKRSTNYRSVKYCIVEPPFKLDVAAMKKYADSQLGRRYSARGFFLPARYGKTSGIYCSQYACYVLIAGGAPLQKINGYSPDLLLRAINGHQN